MAEVNPPSYEQAGCYTAAQDRQIWDTLLCAEGIGGGDELEVTVTTPSSSMAVNVAAGGAFIQGDTVAGQGMYHVYNDGTVTLPVEASDPTDPRTDIVIAEVLDSQYSGVDDRWRLRVVPGTPSPAPSPPAVPDNAIVLAELHIRVAALGVVTGDIEDMREQFEVCQPTVPAAAFTPLFYTVPGSYSFEKADYPDAKAFKARVQAGGGGGGGAGATEPSFGGGGGGGAYIELIIAAATLTASTVVEVGSGGAAGTPGNSGGNAGDSRFGNRIAQGGGGGGTASGDTGRAAGGQPGEGVNYADALRLAGRAGDVGMGLAPGTTINGSAMGGGGGDSHLGHGGRFQVVTGGILSLEGANGTWHGGGGGGAVKSGGGTASGGTGGRGIVIIEPIY